MRDKETADATTWVPICCESVMRYNFFRDADSAPCATLVCVSCGKHLTLQAHKTGSFDEYGEGVRVLHLLSVARPARRKAGAYPPTADPSGEDTL